MAKFSVTIGVAVYYSKDVEIEASTKEEAEGIARKMQQDEDVVGDWGYDGEAIEYIETTEEKED